MIKKIINRVIRAFNFFGVYPKTFLTNVKGALPLMSEYRRLKKDNDSSLFPFGRLFPIIKDKTDQGGTMKGHYFHQDLLVAQKIFENNPKRHIDIGSRTDGFVAHVATYREIEIIDIRNIQSTVDRIVFRQADLMKLPTDLVEATDSISSLHAIEHFGLGRYSDPIDHEGYLKALDNIYQILKSNGTFYFSVPIGSQRIEFNAHRVFSIKYLLHLLSDKYNVITFSYVDDNGDLHKNVELTEQSIEVNFGCKYGCGIFELRKI